MDNNFGYDLDLSQNIPEQLKKWARPKRRPTHDMEGSHHGSSGYAAPTLSLLESRYLDHLRLLDQFSNRKRNQYHSSITIVLCKAVFSVLLSSFNIISRVLYMY